MCKKRKYTKMGALYSIATAQHAKKNKKNKNDKDKTDKTYKNN